jgi:hypothetical protein
MSIQIAVRLPEDIVEFVDGLVSHGDAPSPADSGPRAMLPSSPKQQPPTPTSTLWPPTQREQR